MYGKNALGVQKSEEINLYQLKKAEQLRSFS